MLETVNSIVELRTYREIGKNHFKVYLDDAEGYTIMIDTRWQLDCMKRETTYDCY